jgi:4-amino-4-deoxy-L-arabinose transferase-like glycosyltransferase
LANEKFNRIALIVLSLLQITVSAFYLNSLSRIDNWSAVYAEDSTGYLLVTDYCSGSVISARDMPLMKYRLFSLTIPYAASFLGKIVGIPAAFLIINIILWNATTLLFYELLKLLLKDSYSAFAGAVILTTSLPFIEWGLPIMVDMGAYFWAALIPYLYLRLKDKGLSAATALGALIWIALLTKPMLIILLLFVLLFFLLEKQYRSALTVTLIPVVLILATYRLLGLSFADFSTYGAPRHRGIIYIVSAAFFCFHWGWIFYWKGLKGLQENKLFYSVYLLSFIVPYLVFVHNPRLFFLSYPAIIPLIASGMNKKYSQSVTSKRVYALIGGYIVTSNLLAVVHLYVMRCLKIRNWEGLINFFSQLFA